MPYQLPQLMADGSQPTSDRAAVNYLAAQQAVDNYDPLHQEFLDECDRYNEDYAAYADRDLLDYESDELFNYYG